MSIRVPAEHILAMAHAIQSAQHRIISTGGEISDLHVLVDEGEMELNDASATYGVRRWT